MNRGLKPQMKYANKIACKYVIVLGDNEISSGTVNIKNMENGEQTEIKIDDIYDYIRG